MINKEEIPYRVLLGILVLFAAYSGWAMRVKHYSTPAFFYHLILV